MAYVPPGRRIGGSNWPKPRGPKKKKRPWGLVPLPGGGGSKPIYIPPGGGFFPPRPSRTRSYSNSQLRTISIRPTHTGASYSYYKYTRKPDRGSRIVKTQQAPLYSVFNNGSRISSLQGQQSYSTFSVLTAAQLHTTYLETSANQDGKFWVDSVRCRWMFQNQSEANTFLTIYEFSTRRDSVFGPSFAFASGMTSIQSGAASTADDIGATPFMTTRFTENFKILRKYTVELAQGRTHVHNSFYNMMKNYSDSYYQMDSTDTVLGGWTRGIFVLANGSPYNSAATKTNVSTTPVALDVVQNLTFKSHSNLQNKSVFEIQSDFPTFADGQIIDIGSGEADTVTDA